MQRSKLSTLNVRVLGYECPKSGDGVVKSSPVTTLKLTIYMFTLGYGKLWL